MFRHLGIAVRVFHHTGMLRIALSCSAGRPLEHDPEKWTPVFRKRSCSTGGLTSLRSRLYGVLTRSAASIECLSRAAPKGGTFCFPCCNPRLAVACVRAQA